MSRHRWLTCAFPLGKAAVEFADRRRADVAAWAATKLLIAALAALTFVPGALAHGIAGNRLFPGTLAFDDPAVADELAYSPIILLRHPVDNNLVLDAAIGWSFMRLLTSTIGLGVESGWLHRDWATFARSGFDTTNVTLKAQLFRDDAHETLVSAGLTWGIGGSGAQGVGASGVNTLQPGIFLGKGFGDLPDSLSWLRPFAVTAAVTGEFPLASGTSATFGVDPSGQPVTSFGPNAAILHWGFSIQYSTYYLTNRFTGGPPKSEPLNQFVPLVEFAFDSPQGQKTAATMNPGLAYVGTYHQFAVEAVVPLNSEGGRGVGVRTQVILFLDDLFPSAFGKPLLGR